MGIIFSPENILTACAVVQLVVTNRTVVTHGNSVNVEDYVPALFPLNEC